MNFKRPLLVVMVTMITLSSLLGCALVTTPVEVAGDVVKTGAKVVTYPIRKAVD